MKLRIREIRKERDWTIDHLAALSGYSRGFISQVETGKRNPGAETLVTLSQVLGVTLPELYDPGDLGDDLGKMLDIMRALSPEDRKAAIRAAAGFLDQTSK